MPREVEYEINGRWYRSGLLGREGMRATQAAGLGARYVGGVLQVNAKSNGGNPGGWLAAPEYAQELTPAEYEHANGLVEARLVPYEDCPETWTYKGSIQTVSVEGRIVGEETPAWKQARDLSLAPGECPCGILRAGCDYHR